jgi:hypothetical protein
MLERGSVRERGSGGANSKKKKATNLRKCSYTASYLAGRVPLGAEIGNLKRKGSFTLSALISLHN